MKWVEVELGHTNFMGWGRTFLGAQLFEGSGELNTARAHSNLLPLSLSHTHTHSSINDLSNLVQNCASIKERTTHVIPQQLYTL
jgi:hypothetical protein